MRLLNDHFSIDTCCRSIWTEQNRSFWYFKWTIQFILFYRIEILSCFISVSNRSGAKIYKFVAPFVNIWIELRNIWVTPITNETWNYMTKNITFSYCSINIRNYNLIITFPTKDISIEWWIFVNYFETYCVLPLSEVFLNDFDLNWAWIDRLSVKYLFMRVQLVYWSIRVMLLRA